MAYIGATPGLTILSINDLLDVNTDSPDNRDVLVFDSSTGEYIGRQLTSTDVGEGSNLYYTRLRFDSDIRDVATIQAIRSYFSGGGDLVYDSATGQFSFDVEQVYTQANFDSDFNTSLDAAALGGVGLTYDSASNTLSITNTGVTAGTYGSQSAIPVFTVNAQGQIDSIGEVSVAGVTGVTYDSSTGAITVSTGAGTNFTDSINLSPFSTTDLTEGNNLYYTTARADSDTLAYLTTNSYATQTYVTNSISAVLDGAPAALDTLNELAAAINDDSNFAGTVTASLSTKLNISNFDSSFDTRLATKTTTDLSEGDNKYYTDERVDDRVANLLVGGAGINVVYNDLNNLLEIRIDSAPEVGYDLSANTTDDLSEGISNRYYTKLRVDSDVAQGFADRTTTDLAEGNNLYYTTVRADSDFDIRLATKSTTNLSEGDNLYYTRGRFDSALGDTTSTQTIRNYFSAGGDLTYNSSTGEFTFDVEQVYTKANFDSDLSDANTGQLPEGSNLYYTTARADSDFDARLAIKTTGDLAEGSNLYYTKVRVDSDVNQGFADRTTSDLAEGSNLYYTTARADSDAKNAISVTDNGGDGSLTYTPATGTITYTGPSAAEVRAHFSGGTGVDITNGVVSIGQDVGTTDSVVFGGLQVTGNTVIDGNLQVNGTQTTISSQTLSIEDAMFYLNQLESDGSPTLFIDVGFAANYNDIGSYAHTGFFRDATDGVWKLFQGYTPEPDSDLDIDVNHPSFSFAALRVSSITADTLTGVYAGFDSDFNSKSTSDLSEGTNLYYTTARADSDFDARLSTKSTSDLAEGTNLYYTRGRFDSALADTASIDTIRGYFSAAGDLSYDSSTGVFQFNVEQVYTKSNFDSDFNAALDSSLLNGTGLSYNSTTNTLSITDTGVVSGTYGSTSEIPVFTVNAQGQIDSVGTVSVAGVTGVEYDSATGSFTVTTGAGTSFSDSITLSPFSTSDLTEGNNLYYTTARSDSDFDTRLATKSTDNVSEGTTNLYYTTARTNSDVANYLTTNSYATQTYVSTSVDSAISAILDGAPAALDTLNELAAAINDDSNFAGSITTSLSTKLNIANFDSSFDTRLATKSTDDLSEGSNLYYTTVRADSDFDIRLATKSTSDISEGINLYYTTVRADSDFDIRLATKTSDDISEGSVNVYYTTARHDSDFAVSLNASTTDDLSEGSTNLYYTTSRFDSDFSTKSIGGLTDVSLLGITDGQILAWDSATSAFAPSDVSFQETTITTSGISRQVIDSWSKSSYRSVEYHITVSSNSGFSSSKINVLHNHTNAYISQYGVIGDSTGTFTADIDFDDGLVRLLLTPLDSAAEVQFTKTTISAGTSGQALTAIEGLSDLDSGTSSTDLANGFGILDLNEPSVSAEILNTDLLTGDSAQLDLFSGFGIVDLDPATQPVSGDLETTFAIIDLESESGNQDLSE